MLHEIIALVALTAMEIVLGIDNIVFISIVSSRLPADQQKMARRTGLFVAMGMRIALLLAISVIVKADDAFFSLTSLPLPGVLEKWFEAHEEVNGLSVRDLIVLGGGLFLLWSSVREIHHKVEGAHDEHKMQQKVTFRSALMQIALLDLVFSLDSVITAVGMAESLWVMITAVVLAVGVMLVFAGPVSEFVERHPTVKMLALSFLLLIAVMLVAEGLGTHIAKGYIYFAMAFALGVEVLNLRMKARAARKAKAVPAGH